MDISSQFYVLFRGNFNNYGVGGEFSRSWNKKYAHVGNSY